MTKKIKVVFVGEPSEDGGGPLQEMFTLLINHMARFSGLFEGREGHIVPAHNFSRLNAGEFFLAGKIIATSIVHGGRAPHCFSQTFMEYVIHGKVISKPDPKDIPDYEIQQKVMKVKLIWKYYKEYSGMLVIRKPYKLAKQTALKKLYFIYFHLVLVSNKKWK